MTAKQEVVPVVPDLLPIKRFAARLGISVWTARGMVYRREVDFCKIGAKVLVPAGEVGRIIREGLRPRKVRRLGKQTALVAGQELDAIVATVLAADEG